MSLCPPLQHHDPDKTVRAYRAFKGVLGEHAPLIRDCMVLPDELVPLLGECVEATHERCAGEPPVCSPSFGWPLLNPARPINPWL